MQFLSPPERSTRDSAHAVDIYLAAHAEIPLKYKFGSCWRPLWELDCSKFNIRRKDELLSQINSVKLLLQEEWSQSLYYKCIVSIIQ